MTSLGIIALMRKFLVVLILFFGIAFVIVSFSELEKTVETLKQGNLWFLLLALGIQVGWFFVSGITYRSIYQLLGIDDTLHNLTFLAAASNFINVVAPSAGVGGIAVFIDHAKRRGYSSAKVTVAGALYLLLDYIAFLGMLTLGLIVLIRRNDLDSGEIAASAVMFLIALSLAALLYLGSRSAEMLGSVLGWMARLINRLVRPFIHRDYLRVERAQEFAHEIADGLSTLPDRWHSLLKPLVWAVVNKTLMACILLVTFLSFQVEFSAGTIIGGFAISYLFLVVSPTPSGIGIVEGIMAVALNSLRVDWNHAVIITLAYRAITFWVPLGVGALAFRAMHLGNVKPESV